MNNIKSEIWKNVTGYEELYKISIDGKVISIQRTTLTKGGKFRIVPKKLLKCHFDKNGYVIAGLCKNGLIKNKKVHRLVALAFIPNIDNKLYVNHKDGNKTNNYISNLEWITAQENTDYARNLGLLKFINAPKGEKSGASKLKNEDILQIRYLYHTKNISKSEISRPFNIGTTTAHKIIDKITWKHI